MANGRTIECWDDTAGSPVPCNGPSCSDKMIWMEIVKSGKRMCFTAPAVPLQTKHDAQSGRLIAVMDFDDNHWATCPDRQKFKTQPTRGLF